MNVFVHRRTILTALVLLAISGFGAQHVVRATQPDPITLAWEKAQAAGSYQFASDITQLTIPVAKVTNVGRPSRTDQVHLEGTTNLHDNRLELQLWSDTGSLVQGEGALAIKVENGKSYVRQAGGEWQERTGVLDGIAPQGDFLAYLQAVREVKSNPPETRGPSGRGITFTRYSFALDGPTFAAFVRDQMETAARARGELPAGVTLEAPSYYRDMTGDGELWVRDDGFPLRQILNLNFPEQQDQTVHAQIVVDFSHFGQRIGNLEAGALSRWDINFGLRILDFAPFFTLFSMSALAAVLLYFRRARRLQTAVAITVILSLVVGPLLSNWQINAFFATQSAKAAAQAEEQAALDAQRDLRDALGAVEFDPHLNPVASKESGIENMGYGISPFQSPQSLNLQSPSFQTTDPGTDTDGDGLTDFVEERVGASIFLIDTDGDGLTDAQEVKGFQLGGKTWFPNPTEFDSNHDGLGDGQEWSNDGDDIPDDTDGDGIPDLFDDDNDGDGVPDRHDLAPFSRSTATFSEANPLRLTLDNLSANRPTLVDFQLRPTDPNHLWYAFNVLDWPRNDHQGQMQDVDGKTFADLAAAQGRTAALNESFGDLKLIPMLEIRLPANGANLPPQSDLTPYNISVNNLTNDGSQKVVYVPLSLVTDEQTGARVAFSGRMRYLPSGGWPTPHDVRLAWVVQALTDIPCNHSDPQDVANGCAADNYIHNAPQVLQSYYDDFTLTGLNVSEQHGAKTALIYEDPAVDPNLKDDEALATLAYGLDSSFLAGRDADGNGQRDVTIDEIARRFDHTGNSAVSSDERWGLDNERNVLKVERHDYATFDQATMFMAMTDTVKLLATQFNAVWANDNSIKPTIAYAYEQLSRSVGLDDIRTNNRYVTLNGNNITVNMQPAGQPQASLNTIAGLKWTHYCRSDSNAAWAVCAADTYWNELENRYAAFATLPGDPVGGPLGADVAAGRLFSLQLLDLTLAQGIQRAVQRDNQLISSQYSQPTDTELASDVRLAASGSKLVVVVADFLIMRSFDEASRAAQYFGEAVKTLPKGKVQNAKAAIKALKGDLRNNKLKGTGVAITALVVLGGLTTAAYFQNRGEYGAAIAIRAFVISAQVILSIYGPVSAVNAWRAALGSSASILTAQTELIGVSRVANAIGAVITISIVWGFFIYSMVSNKVSAFSADFNAALAETVAATIYIVLLAVLASTVVGLIIVGVIAVIDAILTAVCELGVDDLRSVPGLGGACFTLGAAATKVITRLLYNYDLMIDTGRNDLVAPGAPKTQLANPNKGFVTGNEFSITLPITTHVVHKNPNPAAGIIINFYLYLFSKENLRSSTFNYSLTQPGPQDVPASRDTMTGAWQNVAEDHKYVRTPMYGGYTQNSYTVGGFNLQPGLNRPASFYLNMGYALPAYECWVIPVIFYPVPVCYTRTFSSHNSNKIETLRYDIFPNTIDGFMALGPKSGGMGLAWDPAFPALRDADGDGLIAGNFGGLDPDDTRWDTDNDGLSDAYELEQRAAGKPYSPLACDTDNDGLTDAQEAQLGTNPANPDSDNDGLTDAEEVWHRVYDSNCQPTDAWSGGWEVTINATTPFTIRVSSDPLLHDSDGDGVSDLAEYQLAGQLDSQNRPYHPLVVNAPPVSVYTETDKPYVAPGGSLVYTTTVIANAAMAPGVLDVFAPAQLGNVRTSYPLNFNPATFDGSQILTQQTALSAQAGLNTQAVPLTSNVRTRLAPTGSGGLAWDSINFQSLGNQGQPTRSMGAAHTGRNGLDNYLMTSLNTDNNGAGTLRTHPLPSGPQTILNTATGLPDIHMLNSRSDVACTTNGDCLVVWEQRIGTQELTMIAGAFLSPDGQVSGSFPIYWIAGGWAFRPVVASDGTDFVVAFELAGQVAPTTRLMLVQYSATGALIASHTQQIESPRVAAFNQPSVAMDLVWIGDRYRLAWKFIRARGFRPFPQIYVGDLDRTGAPLDSLMTSVAAEALETETGAPALAHDPVNNRTLLLYIYPNGDVRRVLFQGADLNPWLRDDWLGNIDYIPGSQIKLWSGEVPRAAYNALADGWLIQTLPTDELQFMLWKPALDGRRLADIRVLYPTANVDGISDLACPANAIMVRPIADFRFEELPGATSFASRVGGFNATCSGNTCPVAGAAGATNAAGNPIGGGVQGPASDYGLSFTNYDQQISFPSPIDLTNDSYSIAYWYRAQAGSNNGAFVVGDSASSMSLNITPESNGALNFFINGKWYSYAGNLNDGDWHFIVATRDKTSGAHGLYLNGAALPISATNIQPLVPGATLRAGGNVGDLDQLQIYKTALDSATVQGLYNNTLQAYCVAARGHQSLPQWAKLSISEVDPRGGKITASGGMTVTIDADKPTSALVGLTNNQFIRGNTVHTIGGAANDATSGVAQVEINVNNSGWQPVNGAGAWSYTLNATSGSYTIQTRATDNVGNVETPAAAITLRTDSTAPTVALNTIPATPIKPTRIGDGPWQTTLGGAVSDADSGVQSVQVLLQGQGNAIANGWQTATRNGNNWSIAYLFDAGLTDPTGIYTVSVRAIDNASNQTADNAATGILRLDVTGPVASFSQVDAVRQVISDTLTISGVITDTGDAGVDKLELAFVALEQLAALPANTTGNEADVQINRIWLPVTVAQPGAPVSGWNFTIPTGLENEYQIDLRATDRLGNVLHSDNVWRGVIDTLAPRLSITRTNQEKDFFASGTGWVYYLDIRCTATDRYLDDTRFSCPADVIRPPVRDFDTGGAQGAAMQALFPDRTIRNEMTNSAAWWSISPLENATVRACDIYGHCAESISPRQSGDQASVQAASTMGTTSQALIIAPTTGSFVASNGDIQVTVAAESAQLIKEVTIRLDGQVVQTLTFAQSDAITSIWRTIPLSGVGQGEHTLTVSATHWAGGTLNTGDPVTFTLDTQPPTVTIDPATLTNADTWQPGSGVLRFKGAVNDAVGLAAVQIREGNNPFVDAGFGNGIWQTALPVTDPEGRTLNITVRAIDRAGRISTVTQAINTDLSSPTAPDTMIISSPAHPSPVNTATFEFTGSENAVAFDCQLDDSAYAPCTSPWTLDDLSKGEHTFRVRAIDAVGNVDLTSASFTWTVNASALDATITSNPANPTSNRIASFGFTGTGSSFECSLDGTAFVACTAPMTYSNLPYGNHTFAVRARNGDQTGAAARYDWVIINAAPVAATQTLTTETDTALDIVLTANDVDALTYQVLNPPMHGVLVGVAPTLHYLPDSGFVGEDSFSFVASDGLLESAPATVTIHVAASDGSAPVTTIALNPATPTGQNDWYNTAVHVTVTASDGSDPNASGVAETRCVLNPATAPLSFDDLPTGCAFSGAGDEITSDGNHTLYAASRDQQGNRETLRSQAINIDRTPPVVTVSGVANGATYPLGSVPTASCASSDATAGVDSAATGNVSGGNAHSVGHFTVRCGSATDKAGNISTEISAVYTVTYNLNKFVVLAQEGVALGQQATVNSGSVGARAASNGPFLANNAEVSIGQQARLLEATSHLLGDTLFIQQQASLYNPSYNSWTNQNATVRGITATPLDVELIPALSGLPTITVGAQNLTVAQQKSLTLNPGSYGALTVGQQGTVTFTGGVYHFTDWSINQQAKISFQAATEIRIAGRLNVRQAVTIGPATNAPTLKASEVVFFVAGKNGTNGGLNEAPKSVVIGQQSTLNVNILAPNGTIQLDQAVNATGAFLAKWVSSGAQVKLTLDSSFVTSGAGAASVGDPEQTNLLYLPLITAQATVNATANAVVIEAARERVTPRDDSSFLTETTGRSTTDLHPPIDQPAEATQTPITETLAQEMDINLATGDNRVHLPVIATQ